MTIEQKEVITLLLIGYTTLVTFIALVAKS